MLDPQGLTDQVGIHGLAELNDQLSGEAFDPHSRFADRRVALALGGQAIEVEAARLDSE